MGQLLQPGAVREADHAAVGGSRSRRAPPAGYAQYTTFQPTFLYESLSCLAIAGILLLVERRARLEAGTDVRALRRALHVRPVLLREHAHRSRAQDRRAARQRVGERSSCSCSASCGSCGSAVTSREQRRPGDPDPAGDSNARCTGGCVLRSTGPPPTGESPLMTETLTPPSTDVAARAIDASKIYGTGEAEVRALDAITVEFQTSRLTAIMGPSGSGKSTLLHCLAGLDRAHVGPDLPRRRRDQPRAARRSSRSSGATARVRLPVVQPDPDAQRAREHHAADVAGGQASPTPRGSTRSSRPSASRTGSRTDRPSSRVVSSSASPSRARSAQQAVDRSSPTSPPATSTRVRAPRSSPSCARRVDDLGQTIVMVTHDPIAAGYADRVVFLADGTIVDELLAPNADPCSTDEELGRLATCGRSRSRGSGPRRSASCSPASR